MPDENTDAAAKLKKLGQRVRDGWAKQHPMPEASRDTVRQTVREEWQREQAIKRAKPTAPDVSKTRKPEPPEPDQDR